MPTRSTKLKESMKPLYRLITTDKEYHVYADSEDDALAVCKEIYPEVRKKVITDIRLVS